MSIATASPCTFNLTAQAGHITLGDANQLLAWGYGLTSSVPADNHMQYPGPTLIVNQGDTVTINLSEQVAVCRSRSCSPARAACPRRVDRRAY